MKTNTLKKLSTITNYSTTTISRVLAGKGKNYRISNKAIDLILREAEKLNFRPNITAQSLRMSKTFSIGLALPNLSNSYFSNIASVIINTARSHNYRVIIHDTLDNDHDEQEAINSLLSYQVEGIIIVPCSKSPEFLEKIHKSEVPVLLIDRYFENSSLSYIVTDNYKGAIQATELLVRNGHKNILCLQGVTYTSPNRERIKGYQDIMNQFGLSDFINVRGDDFSFQSGYIQTKLMLNSQHYPSAIFALSNTLLLGALKAIKESGLKIPEDLSIISFDNETYLDFLDPPITRISQPSTEMGMLAVDMLLEILAGKNPGSIKLSPSLLMGESIQYRV